MQRSFFFFTIYMLQVAFSVCWFDLLMLMHDVTLASSAFACSTKAQKECAIRSINCSFSQQQWTNKKKIVSIYCMYFECKMFKQKNNIQNMYTTAEKMNIIEEQCFTKNAKRKKKKSAHQFYSVISWYSHIADERNWNFQTHKEKETRKKTKMTYGRVKMRTSDCVCVCVGESRRNVNWTQMKINNWMHENLSLRKQIKQN